MGLGHLVSQIPLDRRLNLCATRRGPRGLSFVTWWAPGSLAATPPRAAVQRARRWSLTASLWRCNFVSKASRRKCVACNRNKPNSRRSWSVRRLERIKSTLIHWRRAPLWFRHFFLMQGGGGGKHPSIHPSSLLRAAGKLVAWPKHTIFGPCCEVQEQEVSGAFFHWFSPRLQLKLKLKKHFHWQNNIKTKMLFNKNWNDSLRL